MSTLSTPTASTTIKEIPAMTTTATFTETLHAVRVLHKLLALRSQLARVLDRLDDEEVVV